MQKEKAVLVFQRSPWESRNCKTSRQEPGSLAPRSIPRVLKPVLYQHSGGSFPLVTVSVSIGLVTNSAETRQADKNQDFR
jgi:hypothetical protein